MKKVMTILVVSCFGLSAVALTPPGLPFGNRTWKATLRDKASTGVILGKLRVLFEKTTLDDVRRGTASGAIEHRGDAAESIYWLCYSIVGHGERIWIVSHGEMGGDRHAITGIRAQIVPEVRATPECPALPEGFRPVALDTGLWLGASVSEVRKRFDQPSHRSGARWSYDYQGKAQGGCEDNGGFNVMNWLVFEFGKGKVISLFAGQNTSC